MSAAAQLSDAKAAAAGRQFLAVLKDEITRETARAAANQLGWTNPKIRDGGGKEALQLMQAAPTPAFLLVDISDVPDPLITLQPLLRICDSESRVVVIGMANDVALYRRLMELGVSDYLIKPVSVQLLIAAIEAATNGPQKSVERARRAQLVGLIGARGGVGTSTLALSTAWTISQQRQNVVLIDLDLHFGSLALSLDLEPGRGLREILGNPDRIDSLLISAAMTSANDRLRILGAEESLESDVHLDHDGLAALLADIGEETGYIVVDLPRSLGAMTRHVLSTANVIVVVTDQSLPAMRDTQRLVSLIKAMRADHRIVVVANRVGGVAGEVGRADFERGIGAEISHSIPYEAKTAVATAEQAKPFVEVGGAGKAALEMRLLALALTGTDAPPPTPSLIQRLLRK